MVLAPTTAEKLNIQPTERSMSRIATTKTMPSASMPTNAAPASCWKSVVGFRKFGRRKPTTATSTTSATITPVSSGRRRRRSNVGAATTRDEAAGPGSGPGPSDTAPFLQRSRIPARDGAGGDR
jgi:hypothetical protein